MDIKHLPVLASLLLAGVPAAHAGGHGGGHGGNQGGAAADRLVGLWATDIHVSPAACTPGAPPPPLVGHNTMIFNAGGTLVENPQVTPPGNPGAAQVRTFGLGKWSYEPRTRQYRVLLRFDWYASSDGAYLGYQVVDRTILLSNDRNRAFGPVISTRYAPDGSIVARVCGEGISTRL